MSDVIDRKAELLFEIAQRAIEASVLDRRRRVDKEALSEACRAFKATNKIEGYVDRKSPDWKRLLKATAGEAGVLQESKRHVANARKRLAGSFGKYGRLEAQP